jgi:cardiolipin synthase (CMP-forming)
MIRLIGSLFMPLVFIFSLPDQFFLYFLLLISTDFLDGQLARRLNQKTIFGKILDPIADRSFAIMLVVTIFFLSKEHLGVLIILTLSREILSLPALIYMKIKHKPYVANAGASGKITTTVQFLTFSIILLTGNSLSSYVLTILTFMLGLITAFIYYKKTGLLDFVFAKKSVK